MQKSSHAEGALLLSAQRSSHPEVNLHCLTAPLPLGPQDRARRMRSIFSGVPSARWRNRSTNSARLRIDSSSGIASWRAISHQVHDGEREAGIRASMAAPIYPELTQVKEHPVVELALIDVAADLALMGVQILRRTLGIENEPWATRSWGVKSGFSPPRPSCGK